VVKGKHKCGFSVILARRDSNVYTVMVVLTSRISVEYYFS